MTHYRYEITPRAAELGGGWRLMLIEDDLEVGGGVFPADAHADPHAGMAWFNALREKERAYWLQQAESARAVDASAAYLSAEAFQDAQDRADEWLAAYNDEE